MFKFRKILMLLFAAIIVVSGMGFSAQPAQAAGCANYHVVRAGESLSWIARYYGAYWPYLAQINNIRPPRYTVYPGQVICIARGSGGYYPQNGYWYNGYWYSGTGGRQYTTSGAYWSFSVLDVQQNSNVTIRAQNFPSNVLFNVKMGRKSGGGYDWRDLPNIDSGNGGNFKTVLNIPAEFSGTSQLVVRLIQQKKNGKVFHQDQWFNNTPGGSGTGGRGWVYNPYNYYYWGGIPTIWIVSVARNSSVTIQTNNFPANTDFQVLMGPMGTRGYGYHVSTFNSGGGGTMTLTFPIPPQLYGSYQISIRTQNTWSGYHSYNWFYNNTTY